MSETQVTGIPSSEALPNESKFGDSLCPLHEAPTPPLSWSKSPQTGDAPSDNNSGACETDASASPQESVGSDIAFAPSGKETSPRRRALQGGRPPRKTQGRLPQVRASPTPSPKGSWRSVSGMSSSSVSNESSNNKKPHDEAKYVFEGVHVKALSRKNSRASSHHGQQQQQGGGGGRLASDTVSSANGSQTASTTATSVSSATHMHNNIVLPNGTEITPGELLRQLIRGTTHHCVKHDGHSYFYFRGWEGIELWDLLFFSSTTTNELELTAFGNMLMERGLVHNYTPNAQDFKALFLVLQPLQEPRALNTYIKWPTWDKTSFEDPTAVLLRLCLLLDKACQFDIALDGNVLYRQFQEAVCQLQVMDFPTHPVERNTFTLNLYNMGVRQAALVAKVRGWIWPTELNALMPFLSTIGYRVAGVWYSLADLQALIYGRVGESNQGLVQQRRSLFSLGACLGSAGEEEHYKTPMMRGDRRVLFATSYGAFSSPAVATIFPHKLEETLQAAAEAYCRTNVHVVSNQVILPTLIGWHRHDYGGSNEKVLDNILPYLSLVQMRHVQFLRENGTLYITYDKDFHWKPDVSSNPCSWPKYFKKLEIAHDIHVQPALPVFDERFEGEDEEQYEERIMERSDAGATFFSCDMSEVTMDTHFNSIASTRSTKVLGPKTNRRLEV